MAVTNAQRAIVAAALTTPEKSPQEKGAETRSLNSARDARQSAKLSLDDTSVFGAQVVSVLNQRQAFTGSTTALSRARFEDAVSAARLVSDESDAVFADNLATFYGMYHTAASTSAVINVDSRTSL